MLAISDDRFTNPTASTACKSYSDVVAKLNQLASLDSENSYFFEDDLIALVEHIRLRYRLDPIGLIGTWRYPRIVMGTGYVPQITVYREERIITKGESRTQYSIHSLNIKVRKGTPNVIRSNALNTLTRRLKGDMFALIPPEKNLYSYSDIFGGFICKEKDYVPFMEEAVRMEVYNYFSSEEKIVTPKISAWVNEKREIVENANKRKARQNFIRDCFQQSSVWIFKLPMIAEYPYFFIEVTPSGVSERVFFSDINDLSEQYPHIIGAVNLSKMLGQTIFREGSRYDADLNYISVPTNGEMFKTTVLGAVFPSQRIPSEDEMFTAQAVQPVAEESALSVLNF